jgi:hypothetical protein
MSVHMASFGYKLLVALEELLNMFDEGEGGGDRMATISPEYHAELQALITHGRGGIDA